MKITDLNVTDMPVEPTKIDLTFPTEIKDPSPFVFTGCKGMMLEDFDSLTIFTPIQNEPIAGTVGL